MSAEATWTPPEGTGEFIARSILGHRFCCPNEATLQEAIAKVLGQAPAIPFEREVRLSSQDRVDFMVGGGVAVEVKVDGSVSDVVRQLHRYAQHDEVREILLVTTRATHKSAPAAINGKPTRVIYIGGIF